MSEINFLSTGLNLIPGGPIAAQLVSSALLVLVLLAIRVLAARMLTRVGTIGRLARRRWLVRIRNLVVLVLLVGLGIVWSDQIKQVATALALVAAAFAIVTKELWLNLSGFLFRSGAHFFTIGDRIEVADFHGDVIDQSPMGTTLLEVGSKNNQHTGRVVFIPNCTFLSSPVINSTFFDEYTFHTITVPIPVPDGRWERAEGALLQAAHEVCAPYLERVRTRVEELTDRNSLDTPTTDPRVQIRISDPTRIDLVLRVPIEARRKGRTEQQILRRYLELLNSENEPNLDVQGPGLKDPP